jgi:nitroreductase
MRGSSWATGEPAVFLVLTDHPVAAAYTAFMSDSKPFDRTTADVVLTALRRTRQVRGFTEELVSDNDLQTILEVARWSGSSRNRQPWNFIVVRERGDLQRLAELAPNAKHVAGAAVAIAIAMGGDNTEWDAYDEGRAAERILIAANALGLGAGIGWAIESVRPQVAQFLGLTPPVFVRTIISLGHPTEAARQPKSAPGTARRPLKDLVREL